MAETRRENISLIEQLIADSNLTLVRRAIGAQILASIGLILLLETGFSLAWTWCGLICGILFVCFVLQVIYYHHRKKSILAKAQDWQTYSNTTTAD